MREPLKPMSDTGLHPALKDADLCEYIDKQARRHSRKREDQEDFKQEAWLWISVSPNDATIDVYKWVAYRAIVNCYRRYRGQQHVTFDEIFNVTNSPYGDETPDDIEEMEKSTE